VYSSTGPTGPRFFFRELDRLTGLASGDSLSKVGHRVRVRQQVERIFERLEVVDRQHDHARSPMLRDHDSAVLDLDPFYDLGQTRLGVCQGDLLVARSDHK